MRVSVRVRLEIFSRVKKGELSVAEAVRKLGLSERQARRVWKRYRQLGDAGLIHGLRGRVGKAAKPPLRQEVRSRYREHYQDFNAAHAADEVCGGGSGVAASDAVAMVGRGIFGAPAAAGA